MNGKSNAYNYYLAIIVVIYYKKEGLLKNITAGNSALLASASTPTPKLLGSSLATSSTREPLYGMVAIRNIDKSQWKY